jgi:hypothetical protein
VELYTDMRDPLPEVRLERIHADIHQPFELFGIPLARVRVGEIDIGHPGLPQVPSVRVGKVNTTAGSAAQS